MRLEEEITSLARQHEIDLLGFARVEQVELGYPPRPAEALLPGAKSVVAMAAGLLWGALNCPRGTKGAIKDAQVAYQRLEHASAAIGRFLEAKGFASYTPPASMPTDAFTHQGQTYYAAEWSHRQAAIAARLGVKGLNNLLITPEFGPRVRLSSLLTTAELEPTQRELPEKLCSQCQKCVSSCPVGALNSNPDAHPRLTQPLCKNHYLRPYLDHTTWQTIKNVFTVPHFGSTGIQYVMEGYYFSCAECQRVCPAGRLKTKANAG